MEEKRSDEVEVAEKKVEKREEEKEGKAVNIELKSGKYRHYKGNFYEVLGIARHSETLEELVVYKALYESVYGKNAIWVRPKKMFLENVNFNGKLVPRFQYIGK